MSRASPDNSAKENFSRIVESGQLWRMFYEPSRQADGLEGFATGYMQGNLAALNYLLGLTGELTLEQISQAHKLCMEGVEEGVYCSKRNNTKRPASRPGELLKSHEFPGFELRLKTKNLWVQHQEFLKKGEGGIDFSATVDGIKEILNKGIEETAPPFSLKVVVYRSEDEAEKPVIVRSQALDFDKIKHKLEGTLAVIVKLCDGEMAAPGDNEENSLLLLVKGGDACAHYFMEQIKEYNEAIREASDIGDTKRRQTAILYAIARFVKYAGIGHPYADGTGRLFQMLLPIKLCLDNNIMPPLLNVTMHFYSGHSVDEIVSEMQKGIVASEAFVDAHLAGDAILPLPSSYPLLVAGHSDDLEKAVRGGERAVLAQLTRCVADCDTTPSVVTGDLATDRAGDFDAPSRPAGGAGAGDEELPSVRRGP